MCRWLYTRTLSLTPHEFRCCWHKDVFTLVTSLHGLCSSLSTRAQPHGHATSQPDSSLLWLDCLITLGLKAAGFMCWGGALGPGEALQALGGSSPLVSLAQYPSHSGPCLRGVTGAESLPLFLDPSHCHQSPQCHRLAQDASVYCPHREVGAGPRASWAAERACLGRAGVWDGSSVTSPDC